MAHDDRELSQNHKKEEFEYVGNVITFEAFAFIIGLLFTWY